MSNYHRLNVSVPEYLYNDYNRYRHRMNLSLLVARVLQEEIKMLEMIDRKHFSDRKLADGQHSSF